MEKKPNTFNAVAAEPKKIPDNFNFGMPNQKLTAVEIPGYYTRWINDAPGRVQAALADGYSFVEKGECEIYEDITSMNNGDGNQIRKLVGTNTDKVSPMYAYLMKLPEEWKHKKEAILQHRIDTVENAINSGKYNLGAEGQKSYIPAEGIKIGK